MGHHKKFAFCYFANWVHVSVGFSQTVVANRQIWGNIWQEVARMEIDPLPAPKVFKPKHGLPKLQSYRGTAPGWFWSEFPSNLNQPAKSLVDGDLLKAMALECGFQDLQLLNVIHRDLTQGAVIGCRGRFRNPSTAKNARSAIEEGEKVSDAIADWIAKGFCYGPVDMDEVPADAKFSGIMVRPKPNGSVRIILNLSSPKGYSVNEGIASSEFPTSMSSTSKWLEAMHLAGRECLFCKVDWSDAYKHVAVALEDTNLQWFSWCGKAFKELCLIFGGKSSAGIYDRLAKVVLFVVRMRTGMPAAQCCQHLDDCVAAAAKGSPLIHRFDQEFFTVASALGVKLAPRDDPDKSFGPSTSGTVLGVHYDSVSWTWAIPQEKLVRILHMLKQVMESDHVLQDFLWSLNGKILHVRPLVPLGRFHVNYLIKANSFSEDRSAEVPVSAALKGQCWFWYTMLRVCSGRTTLPDPNEDMPPWTVEVYTDAAGGSSNKASLGVGAVTVGWWTYMPWSQAINSGRKTQDGRNLDRVMSALELVGPLLALVACPLRCRGKPIRFWVDNAGSVYIWKKGYSSSCDLSTTLVKAIATVAAGLGCRVELEKITRCSEPLATMADALSKADFSRFWRTAYENGGYDLPRTAQVAPKELYRWIENPVLDDGLGERLLRGLAQTGEVLGITC